MDGLRRPVVRSTEVDRRREAPKESEFTRIGGWRQLIWDAPKK